MVQNITESILRNPGALVGLLRIKNKDDYTFLHSVSVCTLLVAFCRSRNMDAEITHQAGLGGLLHDTGKALVPDAVLNKPAALTDEEFAVIKPASAGRLRHPAPVAGRRSRPADAGGSARIRVAPARRLQHGVRHQRLADMEQATQAGLAP